MAEFAAASAAVVAEAGVETPTGMRGDVAPDPQLLQLPYGMEIDIRQQTIKQHWLPIMSAAVVAATNDPEMGLEEWETEIWAPAITGIVNRYLPDLLKATDSPEWAMMGVAVTTYGLKRIGKITQLVKGTSARVTPTPVSRESPAFSEVPAPEKPIAPSDSFQVAPAAFGSTA